MAPGRLHHHAGTGPGTTTATTATSRWSGSTAWTFPTVAFFEAGFAENDTRKSQTVSRAEGSSLARFGSEHAAAGRRGPFRRHQPGLQLSRTRAAARRSRTCRRCRRRPDRSAPPCATPTRRPAAGPMPTIGDAGCSCCRRLRDKAWRSTAGAVYSVVEGSAGDDVRGEERATLRTGAQGPLRRAAVARAAARAPTRMRAVRLLRRAAAARRRPAARGALDELAPSFHRSRRSAAQRWGDAPTSRVPGWVYTDPALFREELERFFYRGHWCYVGLECECRTPATSSARRSASASVIMVRDEDGAIHVVENRCAHRGVAFCRERHGHVKDFICPYHLWNYKLNGDLRPAVSQRRAPGRQVNGGMPADFARASTA